MVRDRLNEGRGGRGYSEKHEMRQMNNDDAYYDRPSNDGRGSGYSRNDYEDRRDRSNYGRSDNFGGNGNQRQPQGYSSGNGGPGSDAEEFLNQIDIINRDLDRVEQNVAQIGQLHTRLLNSVSRDETSRYQTEVDRAQDDCSRLLSRSRDSLKKLSAATKRMPSSDGETRLRKSKQSSTAQRLMRIAEDFQRVQESSKKKYRQRMEREIRIARPDATPEEVERALDTNSGPVFAQELLSSRISNQKQTLREVQDRHVEIRKIEESILELFNLFQDMQMLIDTQQERINEIEVRVEDTDVNLQLASTEMTKAVELRKKSRKKAWIIAGIVAVLIIIGIIIVLYVFKDQIFSKGSSGTPPTTATVFAPGVTTVGIVAPARTTALF